MQEATGNKLVSLTPYNIDSYKIDEVLTLVKDAPGTKLAPSARLNLIKAAYQVLGFDLSPDGALAMVSRPKYQLILAPAGGGKTTQTQVLVALEKALSEMLYGKRLRGDRILCLVYNGHNVGSMNSIQSRIAGRIKSGINGINIDTTVYSSTLHSFADQWVQEYRHWLNVDGFKIMKDAEAVESLRNCYTLVSKFFKLEKPLDVGAVWKMYNYAKECMLDFNDALLRSKFPEVDLEQEHLDKLFSSFETRKLKSHKYNFVNQLTLFHKLLTENEEARKRVQIHFDFVVADEVQDFTPLMMEILRLIVGNNKRLLAIGDEDQCIYTFKGADVDNVLMFREIFEGGEVFVLNYNRRCRRNILDIANMVIGQNVNRFNKKILPVKEGGEVEMVPYNSDSGQVSNIVRRIEAMTVEERLNTVICYRDKMYSTRIAEMLESKGIAFNIISGYMPFSHELYGHVRDVLDFLYDPADVYAHLNMYKVTQINKNALAAILDYDYTKRKFNHDQVRLNFNNVDWGKYENTPNFVADRERLNEFSQKIGNTPLKEFFPELFGMIRKYFWDWKKREVNNNLALDNHYTEEVEKFFTSDKTYSELMVELDVRVQRCRRWNDSQAGVTLSTFHGLKGLEYTRVFITNMSADVFPSLDIGSQYLDEEGMLAVREGENRLAYVALTRAKDYLGIFYDNYNPSPYVTQILEYLSAEPEEVIELDSIDATDLLPQSNSISTSSTSKNKSEEKINFGSGSSFLGSALNGL